MAQLKPSQLSFQLNYHAVVALSIDSFSVTLLCAAPHSSLPRPPLLPLLLHGHRKRISCTSAVRTESRLLCRCWEASIESAFRVWSNVSTPSQWQLSNTQIYGQ